MEGRFLQGKVAVITGASRGLGRAMALALGEAGAKLALVSRDKNKLAETQKLAKETGAESEIFIADVRDEGQVGKLGKDVLARFGGTHILINNAGTAVRKNVADFTLDEWKLVLDTNLTGAFLGETLVVAEDPGEAGRERLVVGVSDEVQPDVG